MLNAGKRPTISFLSSWRSHKEVVSDNYLDKEKTSNILKFYHFAGEWNVCFYAGDEIK